MPVKHPQSLEFERLRIEVHDAQTGRFEHLTRIEVLRPFAEDEGTIVLGLNSESQEKQGRENKTKTGEGNIEHRNPY